MTSQVGRNVNSSTNTIRYEPIVVTDSIAILVSSINENRMDISFTPDDGDILVKETEDDLSDDNTQVGDPLYMRQTGKSDELAVHKGAYWIIAMTGQTVKVFVTEKVLGS